MRNVLRITGIAVVFLFCLSFISCGGGGGSGVPPTEQEISELLETQSSAKEFYEELEAENDPNALQKTVDFLKEQENVEDAAIGEDGVSIWIKYSSGVEAIILTKSFGSLDSGSSPRFKPDEFLLDDSYRILARENGKKAIILLPIDSIPKYKDESADDVELCLTQSGYSVEVYRNQDVTVDLMRNLSDYAFIYMTTHGGVGFRGGDYLGWNVQIMTGEITSVNSIIRRWNYLRAGMTSGLTIFSPEGSDNTYFGLNRNFFDDYTYPGSFVYINACSSLKKDNLADVFLENGAGIFVGWDNISFLDCANRHNPGFFSRLAESGITFKNAYDASIALYYPCSVYKHNIEKNLYRVILLNEQAGENMDNFTFDYTLNLKYKGNPDFVLNKENFSPVADIIYPLTDSVFTEGDAVAFSGIGVDAEDGNLTGDSLVWTSDKDGQIGTGQSFSINSLSIGNHIITLTAADSDSDTDIDIIGVRITTKSVIAGSIPDTGLIKCYNDAENDQIITCPQPGNPFYGQDACYNINPPSYAKMDIQGNILSDSASEWALLKDNVTGLIWEIKNDEGGIHDKDNTYTWGNAQSIFIANLNSSNYGGYNDWRLPAINELINLASWNSVYDPELGCVPESRYLYLPDNDFDYCEYWSSTAFADYLYGDGVWYFDFTMDKVNFDAKSYPKYAMAVRGKKAISSLVVNGDGTVTDVSTGLMWQQATPQLPKIWKEALEYCEGLELVGYSDWRLPNIKELYSIVDFSVYNPSISNSAFPGTKLLSYWSSTTYLHTDPGGRACTVNFCGTGYVIAGWTKQSNCYFRAVRNISQ